METGQQLKVSSDRLVKPGIEPATPGLQGKRFIHYTTAAPEISCAGSNNDLCTFYKNSEFCGEAAPATTGMLCNHQCVVSMRQKMLPVRCNKKSSIKHLLVYQEKTPK